MHTVYILQSISDPLRFYTGYTSSSAHQRLSQHNQGTTPHTRKFRPWALRSAITFTDEARARAFEQYLKSGSGRAFAKRHF